MKAKCSFFQQSSVYPIIICLILLCADSLQAQGWERFTPALKNGDFLQTADGGFVMASTVEQNANFPDCFEDRWALSWYDADGQFLSSVESSACKEFDPAVILESPDGHYILGGGSHWDDSEVLKVNSAGEQLWAASFPDNGEIRDGIALPDGSTVFISDERLIFKMKNNGPQSWQRNENDGGVNFAIALAPDGHILVAGQYDRANGDDESFIEKIDADSGQLIWQKTFSEAGAGMYFRQLIVSADGGIVLAGYRGGLGPLRRPILLKTDEQAQELWRSTISDSSVIRINDLVEQADGGFALIGDIAKSCTLLFVDEQGQSTGQKTYFDDWLVSRGYRMINTADGDLAFIAGVSPFETFLNSFYSSLYLVKTDQAGISFPQQFYGRVFFDDNDNCLYDAGEVLIDNWAIQLAGAGRDYLKYSDENGRFELQADTGIYAIQLQLPSPYWKSCLNNFEFQLDLSDQQVQLDFPIAKATLCPYPAVEISGQLSAYPVRGELLVEYCNQGTVTLDSLFIDCKFVNFSIQNTTIPYTKLNDTTFRFALGPIPALACASFEINGYGSQFTNARFAYEVSPDSLCMTDTTFIGEAQVYRFQDLSLCAGEEHEGLALFRDTLLVDTIQQAYALEIRQTAIEVLATFNTMLDLALEAGMTYQGIPLFNDTTFVETFSAANGCDSIVQIHVSILTHTSELSASPLQLSVHPNPFRQQVMISLSVLKPTTLELEVYDALGRKLKGLPPRRLTAAGEHQIEIDAAEWPNGLYWLRLIPRSEGMARLEAFRLLKVD